jgi:hypothetical protein
MSAPLRRIRFPQARGYVLMGVSAGVVIAEDDDLLGAAGRQQMASDIAKLKADEQDVFDKISSASPRGEPLSRWRGHCSRLRHRPCAERVKSGRSHWAHRLRSHG